MTTHFLTALDEVHQHEGEVNTAKALYYAAAAEAERVTVVVRKVAEDAMDKAAKVAEKLGAVLQASQEERNERAEADVAAKTSAKVKTVHLG